MINVNDLRIGNIVFVNGKDKAVQGICNNKILVEGSDEWYDLNSKDVWGIELSDNGFYNLGFSRITGDPFDGWSLKKGQKGKMLRIHLENGSWGWSKNEDNFIIINYIHQLQNLGYILSGMQFEYSYKLESQYA